MSGSRSGPNAVRSPRSSIHDDAVSVHVFLPREQPGLRRGRTRSSRRPSATCRHQLDTPEEGLKAWGDQESRFVPYPSDKWGNLKMKIPARARSPPHVCSNARQWLPGCSRERESFLRAGGRSPSVFLPPGCECGVRCWALRRWRYHTACVDGEATVRRAVEGAVLDPLDHRRLDRGMGAGPGTAGAPAVRRA